MRPAPGGIRAHPRFVAGRGTPPGTGVPRPGRLDGDRGGTAAVVPGQPPVRPPPQGRGGEAAAHPVARNLPPGRTPDTPRIADSGHG
jgi:hypothetical protein